MLFDYYIKGLTKMKKIIPTLLVSASLLVAGAAVTSVYAQAQDSQTSEERGQRGERGNRGEGQAQSADQQALFAAARGACEGLEEAAACSYTIGARETTGVCTTRTRGEETNFFCAAEGGRAAGGGMGGGGMGGDTDGDGA